MTSIQIIQRKLFLKRQAARIIRQDITVLREQDFLQRLKRRLERQIDRNRFDRDLSLKLDAVEFLIDGDGDRQNLRRFGRQDR